MMFHTIGLNTGSVRLETRICGFCCAVAALPTAITTARTAANRQPPRRNTSIIIPPNLAPPTNDLQHRHRGLRVTRRQPRRKGVAAPLFYAVRLLRQAAVVA